MSAEPRTPQPEHVAIVGAGMVGLSTAWFLQERGVQVTVLDRSGPAAGSSWGNAGWVSPGLTIPLADPTVLTYGLKGLLNPDSPLYVPMRADASLLRFLTGFAARCTMRTWRQTMSSYVPVNQMAISAYDELEAGGVQAVSNPAPIMAAFAKKDDSAGLVREIELIREAGLDLQTEVISSEELRAAAPIISPDVEAAIRIDGQRAIDPGAYVHALADAVRARGGQVIGGAHVSALRHGPGGITIEMFGSEPVRAQAVVLATGAWLPELAKPFGVRMPVRAGRGYSFSVPMHQQIANPVYFPHERIACSPIGGRLRVGGTMEFRGPDEALDTGRVEAIVRQGKPLLTGVDWDERQDVWVGSRPVSLDGLPLIGPTRAPGVWVNGGHGMWGVSLGPISGKLLAEYMTTGNQPDELGPMHPLR